MNDAPVSSLASAPSRRRRCLGTFVAWLLLCAGLTASGALSLGALGGLGLLGACGATTAGPAPDGGGSLDEDGGTAGDGDGGTSEPDGGPPPVVLGTTPVDRLYIQPRDDNTFLATAIAGARSSIDVVAYILTDDVIENALVAAKRRGVTVRVLFDKDGNPNTASANAPAKTKLTGAGVPWKAGPARFANVHQKTVVIDAAGSGAKAYVMTLNPSAAGFNDNREYAALITRAAELTDLGRLFAADWNNAAEPSLDSPLVVSNSNARDRITQLVRKAERDVLATLEVFTDGDMRGVLVQRKNAGARIRIVLADPRDVSANTANAAVLKSYGFEVRFLHTPVMHAKLIVVDGVLAYVGSVNMTPTSMNGNREVGLIVDQAAIVNQLKAQAEADWNAATAAP